MLCWSSEWEQPACLWRDTLAFVRVSLLHPTQLRPNSPPVHRHAARHSFLQPCKIRWRHCWHDSKQAGACSRCYTCEAWWFRRVWRRMRRANCLSGNETPEVHCYLQLKKKVRKSKSGKEKETGPRCHIAIQEEEPLSLAHIYYTVFQNLLEIAKEILWEILQVDEQSKSTISRWKLSQHSV